MNFKPLTVTERRTDRTPPPIRPRRSSSTSRHDSYLELAPRPVRRAQRGVPADGQPHRPEHHPGCVRHSIGGHKHTGQIRLDITNFGNLLNNNWGVGQRLINSQILTSPTADATGKLTYNLQTLSGNLITTPLQTQRRASIGQRRTST